MVAVLATPAGMTAGRRGGATAGSTKTAVWCDVAETARGGVAPIVIWEMETAKALELTVSEHEKVEAVNREGASDCFLRTASSISNFPTCTQ